MMGNLRKVQILAGKCVKQVVRQRSTRTLMIVSTLLVFPSLYLMWYLSQGYSLHYLTSASYNRLSFDVECYPADKPLDALGQGQLQPPIRCRPAKELSDSGVGNLSPTDILINVVSTGNILGESGSSSSSEASHDFSVLLSNIMMNGFPLLGLDDYVGLSDFVNAKLGEQGRQSILDYSGYKDRFSNFLDVRKNQLRITGHRCLAEAFLDHLGSHSSVLKELHVRVFDSMADALQTEENGSRVWAVLEIAMVESSSPLPSAAAPGITDSDSDTQGKLPPIGDKCKAFTATSAAKSSQWSFTVRMHPSAIPDTRNFKWSPLKSGASRVQSGQLLYFISGFLTLQLELQNFLSVVGKGGPVIQTEVFKGQSRNFPQPSGFAREVADAIMLAGTRAAISHAVSNMTTNYERPNLYAPLYHRAFPTHMYMQQTYWHSFGSMIAAFLIIFFALPAAVTSGAFRREAEEGQLDVLSTLSPKMGTSAVSASAWMLCCFAWNLLSFFCCWVYFALVLRHSYSVLPAVCLLLCGTALGPIALIVGNFVKRADTLVIAVPTVAFVSLLPGLLYSDLAFDVQRSLWLELMLCLLPPSGAALVLREICANEALSIAVTWNFSSSISRTPMYLHVLVLVFDCILYGYVAISMTHYFHDCKAQGGGVHSSSSASQYRAMATSCIFSTVARLRSLVSSHSYAFINEDIPGDTVEEVEIPGLQLGNGRIGRSRSRSRISDSDDLLEAADSHDHVSNPTVLKIENLCTSYATSGVVVEVLSDVNAELKQGCVTLLLGSNGAGKTTMMRILCGLSRNYTGTIALAQNVGSANSSARQIGWCPQEDALFDCLTVREHMQLFSDLLSETAAAASAETVFASAGNLETLETVYIPPTSRQPAPTKEPDSPQETDINEAMEKLGLLEHADKAAYQLSGGMKRRLSLALALAGSPKLLLLDEPSSGCDSWTRELIRQRILSRKASCAILVSTHHIDDVEVISDNVWFLNDRDLVFDGPISDLTGEGGLPSSPPSPSLPHLKFESTSDSVGSVADKTEIHSASPTLDAYLEFSTWDPVLKRQFQEHMHSYEPRAFQHDAKVREQEDDGKSNRLATWRVPSHLTGPLKQFLARLEEAGVLNWSLSSPSVYNSLVALYSSPSTSDTSSPSSSSSAGGAFVPQAAPDAASGRRGLAGQIQSVLGIRRAHLLSQLLPFFATQVFIPFLIVLAVTVGCTDVSYPRTELSSQAIAGVSEVLVSVAPPRLHSINISRSDDDAGRGHAVFNLAKRDGDNDGDDETLESERQKQFFGYRTLRSLLGSNGGGSVGSTSPDTATLSWRGAKNSDSLFKDLYSDYYSHNRNRWGAFVVEDRLDKWIESTVRIHESALRMDIFVVFEELAKVGQRSCLSVDSTTPRPSSGSTHHPTKRRTGAPPSFPPSHAPTSRQSPAPSKSKHPHPRQDIANANAHANITANATMDAGGHQTISTATFCDANLREGMRISLERRPSVSPTSPELSLVIRSYQSMNANITMLSNVTTDHAAPVFLKELAPRVYASLLPVVGAEAEAARIAEDAADPSTRSESDALSLLQARYTPQYRLFSHPLPEVNFTSQVYTERGYLGATMIVMFMLITSIICVRFVCQTRKNGVKTMLHLGGLSPLAYWMGNFFADAATVMLPLCSVGVAVYLGGSPIRDYFITFPPFPFCLYIVSCASFSLAVVASSYCFSALSTDQLASQLTMLISAMVGGVFLKLYLDRHNSPPFLQVGAFFQVTSPVFAFSTCMFDMFKAHAVDVSVAAGVGASQRHMDMCIERIFYGAQCMLLQAVVYLFLTVAVDMYTARIMLFWTRLLWHRHTIEDVVNKMSLFPPKPPMTESTGILSSDKKAVSYGPPSDLSTQRQSPSLTPSGSVHDFFDSFGGSGNGSGASTPPSTASADDVSGVVNLLECKGVCIQYPNKSTLALRDFNAVIHPRERIALMGINGGGKSTLFRALALAQNIPVRGSLHICGLDAVFDQWALGPTGSVGYVPQDGGLLAFLSVQETVRLFDTLRPGPGEGATPFPAGVRSDFPGIVPARYLHYPAHALSGGNKKKLLVHVANAGTPRLLLLDECTTGVDPVSAERLVDHLSTLDPSQGLLFASHRIDECVRVCTRAIMLYEGQKHFDGPMTAFDSIASEFYQVDLVRDARAAATATYATPEVLLEMLSALLRPGRIERVVEYSPCLFRLTFEKRAVPLTRLWEALLVLLRQGELLRFAFRVMSSEEAIGALTSAQKA